MAANTQTDILLTLSYLMGETTVPSSGTDSRKDFIQSTIDEVYSAYPWRDARAIATLSVSSGVATLPTTLDIQHGLNVSYLSGTDQIPLTEIDAVDEDKTTDGNGEFWLTNPTGSQFILNTKDSSVGNISVKYQTVAPVVNASITTPRDKNTIALGARRYLKMAQNPDADISQDESLFQKRLSSDIASEQVPAPRKHRVTAQSRSGYFTGQY